MSVVIEVAPGIRRLTFALPLGIDHVHCYLVRRETGGWMLVDTGLGLPDAGERWERALAELAEPVELIFVTHFHPDHVGGAAVVAELTGAPVLQGRLDHGQCVRAWGSPDARGQSVQHSLEQGMPRDEAEAAADYHDRLAAAVQFLPDPRLVDPGDSVDGWDVLHLPGHADGHLALLRDGVLVVGDALLGDITPNVGIYPGSSPDPLADYLASLECIAKLVPRLALPGHGPAIQDPANRAAETLGHHRERLEDALTSLDSRPQTAYEVSLALFPDALQPPLRRMALAESLAHLEHLARRGQIERVAGGPATTYRR